MKKFSLMAALALASLGSALGVAVATKTPIQNAPLVGCIGQPLDNGVWRFTVTGQQAGVGNRDDFWFVVIEATNLTQQVQDSVNIIDESQIMVTDSLGQTVKDGAIVAIGGDAARLRLAPGETGLFTLMSRTAADIQRHAKVSLAFQGTKAFLVAVEGRASLIHDKAEMKKHWTPDLDHWFKDGIDSEGLVMIQVDATRLHYWDGEDDGEIKL